MRRRPPRSAPDRGDQEGARRFVSNESPPPEVLDAFLTGAGARTEHYEIAAYEGLMTMAEAMGEGEVVDLLSENLEQEKTALGRCRRSASGSRRTAPSTRLARNRACANLGDASCPRRDLPTSMMSLRPPAETPNGGR